MKKLFSLFAILLSLNSTVFAKNGSMINGNSHLENRDYDSLEVNGSLTFKDLFIKNSIVVNGSLQGKNLKCHRIKSNGSVDIDGLRAQEIESNGSFSGQHIDIAGDAQFNSGVEIKAGKLHDIQITNTKSILIDTKVNGHIRVKKASKGRRFFAFKSSTSSAQILELRGDTVISGDVVFEEDGEIHLFDGAKIEGKIVKAKVIQK